MKKIIYLTSLLFTLTMHFSVHALSTKLNIVTEHLAPFQIVDDDMINGISSEIIKATLDASPYPYNLSAHPWTESYSQAKKEKNTCIYSLVRMPNRENLFQWVGPITKTNISFYSLSKNKIIINDLADARKYKTAVVKDDATHHFLLSKGFEENTHFYAMNNYDGLLKLLDIPSRDIDLVIINDDLLSYRLNHSKDILKYKKVHSIEDFSFDFYLACSLNTKMNIVNNLSDTMKKLEQNGTFLKIRNKWKGKLIYIP